LSGDGDGRQMIATSELGVSEDESRGQGEGDQKNERDGCEAMIGNRFPFSTGGDLFGAVPTSVKESVCDFNSPLSQTGSCGLK
jgi:hypothetical protein